MFSSFRTRFGIPGVISVIALVFAMFGGAYAASNDGGSDKASASAKKSKKGPRGPRGFKGPAGPAGPAGAQGPAGPAGAQGPAGAAGKNGTNGTNGVGVTSQTVGIGGDGGKCVNVGGSKFTAANGVTYACNGAKGKDGEDGKPWTAELESGATLTGVWTLPLRASIQGENEATPGPPTTQYAAFNWPVPLPAKIPGTNMHFVSDEGKEVILSSTTFEPEEVTRTICTGTAANPMAPAGHFCVYAAFQQDAVALDASFLDPSNGFLNFPPGGASSTLTGAILQFEIPSEAFGKAMGTWAVTAPAAS